MLMKMIYNAVNSLPSCVLSDPVPTCTASFDSPPAQSEFEYMSQNFPAKQNFN